MRRSTRIIISIITFLLIHSFIYSQSPQIVQLLNQVNKDSITLYIRQLSGDTTVVISGVTQTILSRHKNQPGNELAAQFIHQKLQSFGLNVQYEVFSSTGKNVIATKQGSSDSHAYFIVCAHYDDMPSGTTAPGADDNASGTATVIELARVFSQYNFNYTIKFICFDEEEQGLIGSNYYATQARNRNDSIIGVINLDMTAYDNNNDGMVDVHRNSVANTSQIANEWVDNIYQYGINLTPRYVNSQPYSDHYSFQQKNYGAILIIEYDLEFNPRYHTVNDKIQYLNMNYAHKIAQVTAATAAEYLQVISSSSITLFASSGWNLLSIPIQPIDGRKSILFPDAVSYAYFYDGGYVVRDTIEPGKAYWLKFNNAKSYQLNGQSINQLQIPVKSGWNLIGSLNGNIPVSSITTSPPNIISSLFYGYNGSYFSAQQIESGKGYWLKVSQNGFINMNILSKHFSTDLSDELNFDYTLSFSAGKYLQNLYLTKKVIDKSFYELPPEPPSKVFDVRFSDNKMVSSLDENSIVKVNSDIYPVEVKLKGSGNDLILLQIHGLTEEEFLLTANQSISINQPIQYITIKKQTQPGSYVLYQNYPNPFNPVTTIGFYLPIEDNLQLNLYNLQGELISTLTQGKFSSGYHKIDFDARNFSSGIYIYELRTTGGFRDIKKMVLLK